MTLSEEARARLADVVALQPTKNAELAERWDIESGKEVHRYLETELSEYYYRDENSLIRATPEAQDLVDVEPGVEENGPNGEHIVRIPSIQAKVVDVLPDPEGDPASIVALLHALREEHGIDPSTDEVRGAVKALKQKGVIAVEYRTVPTYRLAMDRDRLTVEIVD